MLKLSWIASSLQLVLNVSLAFLAAILVLFLSRELYLFSAILMAGHESTYHSLENILLFFLYFEFISMIVKYFKEQYHFPIRYFMYIGITAMVRFIIVDHESPTNTLIYAFVILLLIMGYFIINYTPKERP
ncbi:phosphate-starvation-inducible protein PsiE [Ammoniphilus sp. YIM 78166]|uniref:phosphate-starvation-inducible protein PsiE n=1 Tax=Ammoniphilus sp. YIM 78166 TaxID=1644106 RepID=UPI00106F4A17|nr:phosphate-starvation-inducible protein PsiE [Ammoniphilus sp. YIM 78166]